MDVVTEFLVLVLVALAIVIVGWLELRYLKRRKKDHVDVAIIKDEAYSAIATTKAVASSLRENGRDVMEAETIIYRAESAYERRDYEACKELADQARAALRNSKTKELIDLPEPPALTKEERLNAGVPANSAKMLPANYLESKFIIETVESVLETAVDEARAEAELHYRAAKRSFEEGDYTAALGSAMRSRRALQSSGPAPAENKAYTEIIALPKKRDPTLKCPGCGADIKPEDGFCFSCGKRQGIRTCPSCSNEVSDEDAFCRKCGTKLEA